MGAFQLTYSSKRYFRTYRCKPKVHFKHFDVDLSQSCCGAPSRNLVFDSHHNGPLSRLHRSDDTVTRKDSYDIDDTKSYRISVHDDRGQTAVERALDLAPLLRFTLKGARTIEYTACGLF